MSNESLKPVNARLFEKDVRLIKRIAAQKGLPWQVELRLLVRRSLRGETREITVLKERPH